MRKSLLVFLFVSLWTTTFGQKKINEKGNYIYLSNTEVVMQGVKTDLKLDPKTNKFSAITLFSGDLSKSKEKLDGIYLLRGDSIIFSFKYSQVVINPMFNCKDITEGANPIFCVDTLIYKTDSIFTKDKGIVLKRKK